MELLKVDRTKMIWAILQDYYYGVIEAANDNPDSFSSYSTMACQDPVGLARSFAGSMRVILEQKPTSELCTIYAELNTTN